MRFAWAVLGLAGWLMVSGCAGVDFRRVTSADQEGLRYWRPAPYLALQRTEKDGKVTCEVKMLTLPDKSEEYAITIRAGMGAAKVNPTLHEGWRLDAITTDIDSKSAENLEAVANLIKSVAPAGLVAGPAARSRRAVVPDGCSGIFRVDYYDPGRIAGFTRLL
jgi:hypothetical protein